MLSNISVMYMLLKSTFSGLQFCRWQYGSIFIHVAIVAVDMKTCVTLQYCHVITSPRWQTATLEYRKIIMSQWNIERFWGNLLHWITCWLAKKNLQQIENFIYSVWRIDGHHIENISVLPYLAHHIQFVSNFVIFKFCKTYCRKKSITNG